MTLIDPHLDVDQVSAAVDDGRDPAIAAHLLVCLACREQVDAWRRVLSSMADVPPIAPDVLDRMVELALATPAPPAVAPMPTAAGRRQGRVRGRLPMPTLSAVAAAVVVAVLVTASVVGLRHADSGGTASSATAAPTASGASDGKSSTAGPAWFGPATVTASGPAQLTAELRHLAPSWRPASLPADTPCLRRATELAAVVPAVSQPSPWYDEGVRLGGAAGRAFVFDGSDGFVAVIVRSDGCSLLATLSF